MTVAVDLDHRPSLAFYLSVGLVAGSIIALQIGIMRVFSVGSWAHFGSLVVSLAMFGFGLTSAVMCVGKSWFERHWVGAIKGALLAFGGAGPMLGCFLARELGMNELVYRPSLSWMEYAHPGLITGLLRTHVLSSLRKHVRKHFTHDHIRQVMEFPVLFLGAAPQNTPALYSLMNYADMALGTWYPMGGMGSVTVANLRDPRRQADGLGTAQWAPGKR